MATNTNALFLRVSFNANLLRCIRFRSGPGAAPHGYFLL
jgi:hypothetical protein